MKESKIPYIGFSNDTLESLPKAKEGDLINCPNCKGKHLLECGTSEDKKSNLILFYNCEDTHFLGAIAGNLVIGVKSDVKGSI